MKVGGSSTMAEWSQHHIGMWCSVPLPRLDNGDWLLFPAMGAYTLCGASNFNGIPAADVRTFYVQSDLRS